jgi:hypothetical protein
VNTPTTTTSTSANPGTSRTGALDIKLIYGTRDTSFTIVINTESDLNGLVLRSVVREEDVAKRFENALQLTQGLIANTCLSYVLEGEQPPRVSDCDGKQVFEAEIQPTDVFWYTSTNQSASIAVMQNGVRIGDLCSASTLSCLYKQ